MKNPIIETRLNQMIAKKSQLLKMKKRDRGNQLIEIQKTITRLKRWLGDPATEIPTPRKEISENVNHANHNSNVEKSVETLQSKNPLTNRERRLESIRSKSIGELITKAGERIANWDREQRVAKALEQWKQYNTRNNQETPGNQPEMIQDNPERSNVVPESDQWRLMSVESVFQRMDGNH